MLILIRVVVALMGLINVAVLILNLMILSHIVV